MADSSSRGRRMIAMCSKENCEAGTERPWVARRPRSEALWDGRRPLWRGGGCWSAGPDAS
jgi:hypothetical protein